ncbi:DnaJ domain-containing protein [Aestuariispira insulae]|uniref:DnaJ-like protein n=1 Tax=Aestuariispira insulae TaxID=1461337 RepID=A0A3D9HXA0_9PROT|nr:DnaJ domain-containing protein [Aestuariispira insulae]RED54045.1 DnaJ-like protein [Aestuariispira insulae]
MSWFLMGVAVLFFLLAGLWAIANADPEKLARIAKWVFVTLLVLLVLTLVVRGGFHLVWLLMFGLLPWIGRLRNIFKGMKGPSAGQFAEVKSDYLHMRLDQVQGEMDGYVLKGAFEGRYLNQMDLADCMALRREIDGDARSVQLLESYLDKTHGPDWRDGFDSSDRHAGQAAGAMSRQEAFKILGLSEGAGEEEIRKAHRELMKQMHPDRGGSGYLAAKINEAKDVLLGR